MKRFLTPTFYILSIGIVIRISIFVFLYINPIDINGKPVGPNSYQTSGDIGIYVKTASLIKGDEKVLDGFYKNYKKIIDNTNSSSIERYAGPVYPALMLLFDYSADNILPFSLFTFLVALGVYVFWQLWMIKNLGYLLSIPFILLIQITWFGIFIYPDIFYMAIFTILFHYYHKKNDWSKKSFFWISIVLLVGIRPNSLALVLFFIFLSSKKILLRRTEKIEFLKLISLILLFMLSTIYYLPYAIIESGVTFHPSKALSLNILNNLGLDSPYLGSLLDAFFKICWLFGFHPSKSGNIFALFMRFFFGFIFVAGFLKCVSKRNNESILLIINMIPLLIIFPPHWRQIVVLMPIMYYYGMTYFGEKFDINIKVQ